MAQNIGAEIVGDSAAFSKVVIDSRVAEPDSLFVALPGTKDDGHRYVESAFQAGACGAMVDSAHVQELNLIPLAQQYRRPLVIVNNTVQALQAAAAFHLSRFPRLLRIGITGSSGKTTTKELAASMISQEYSVVTNSGNFNSDIGFPLTVFSVRETHDVGIFELGMNHRGEIRTLTQILRPHIALITTIGAAHIGNIGSLDGIAAEKKAIFSAFSGTEVAFIPIDSDYHNFLSEGVDGRVILYEELMDSYTYGIKGTTVWINGKAAHCVLSGQHNVHNISAAIALARVVPVSTAAICKGLAEFKPLFGRGEIIHGIVTIICDCYNANPESMEAAIDWCDGVRWHGKKCYILGAMKELGQETQNAHNRLGELAAHSQADIVCFFGAETESAFEIFGQQSTVLSFFTENIEKLSRFLVEHINPGDLVLLKGSRACALERLVGILNN
ncbi:MAG: UDP-N-acetylmuramoyl-tripeptide--D-alanyl-D-alanine ligase [Treponema sp.]|jgi:UDP-N-acetylmuramoyl-tripeptide--D-alanyl-D-alanine ligase|nr:UDP-N-acetylmuramoyl-tripeptide--D-alanyl-D-alanine ligase [Treponema sp.]